MIIHREFSFTGDRFCTPKTVKMKWTSQKEIDDTCLIIINDPNMRPCVNGLVIIGILEIIFVRMYSELLRESIAFHA